ncbi:MAG: NACHT domain-containing protein, partial [Chloroflexota bacterium]
MRSYWIERVLEPSLRDLPPIQLNCVYQPSVIYPWEAVLEPSQSINDSLVPTTSVTHFFDNSQGELLITGAPGAGKTTLLLQLAQELVSRAEHDDHLPIPVILKLSSWSEQRLPLAEWLVEELQHRYDISPALGQEWIAANQLVLLLDGLDEVAVNSQVACVQAMTQFRREHVVDLVVTCRQNDYEKLQTLFTMQGIVTLQPLTSDDIMTYLNEAGVQFSSLQCSLQTDQDLAKIASSPLMLHLIMTVFQSTSDTSMALDTSPYDYRHQLITRYTEYMLKRRGVSQQYTPQQIQHWLIWLARHLSHQSCRVFSIAQ